MKAKLGIKTINLEISVTYQKIHTVAKNMNDPERNILNISSSENLVTVQT